MSLLDPIAICEAVRQTVMQQDVFLAVRSDAPLGGGAGTWDDPYYAAAKSGLTESQNAALFDAIMNDATKVPAGTTVHLGPGTFCTTGRIITDTRAGPPGTGYVSWDRGHPQRP